MPVFSFDGDGNDFEAVREEAEKLYASIDPIPCPYFNIAPVAFNALGIRHLKFKADDKARTREDQYPRLKLLHLAPRVIALSRTVQGIWHTKQFESRKSHGRWERVLKNVVFYEFVAVLQNVRIKVIVKQVEEGKRYFWSIIPFWKLNATTHKRMLYSGSPDTD